MAEVVEEYVNDEKSHADLLQQLVNPHHPRKCHVSQSS